jgi:hypothetical protein
MISSPEKSKQSGALAELNVGPQCLSGDARNPVATVAAEAHGDRNDCGARDQCSARHDGNKSYRNRKRPPEERAFPNTGSYRDGWSGLGQCRGEKEN